MSAVYMPQDITLDEACARLADKVNTNVSAKTWPELHTRARALGYTLIPGPRKAEVVLAALNSLKSARKQPIK